MSKKLILSHHEAAISHHDVYKYSNLMRTVYAKVHEIEYKYSDAVEVDGRGFKWSKIPLIHKYIDLYDEILWVDDDVLFTNLKTDVFSFIKSLAPPAVIFTFINDTTVPTFLSTSIMLFDCSDDAKKMKIKTLLNDWWNRIDSEHLHEIVCLNEVYNKHKHLFRVIPKCCRYEDDKQNVFHQVSYSMYKLATAGIVKKHYYKLINYKKKRIAIIVRSQNLYSNGAGQNCIFMGHAFEACGYDVDFLTTNKDFILSPELPYKIKSFEPAKIHEYCLFIFGSSTLPQKDTELIREKGIKCVMFNPCNVVDAFHQENFLYLEKKSDTPLFEMQFHKFSDFIWLTDNHKESSLEYLEIINRKKIQVVPIPLLWSPLFLTNVNSFKIPTYQQRKLGENKIDFVILEPNISYCKSGWIPLIICEKFYLENPEKVNKVYFFNSPTANNTAIGMMKSLKLGEDNKIKYMTRLPINDIFTFFGNPEKNSNNHVIFISHNINVPINYAYYDILYTGFPFIHNSTKLNGLGYYYTSLSEGVDAILKCYFEYDVETNINNARTYLETIDPYNDDQIKFFKALVAECEPLPNPETLRNEVVLNTPSVPIPLSPSLSEEDVRNLQHGQKKMTNMLREFDRICRKYGLRYWCVGGTLIGAIRHKGWIPWDGDVDVHMFDTDWERFLSVAREELPTTMAAFNDSDIGKIKDLYSHYKEMSNDHHSGLQIDVFKYKETHIKDVHAIQAYVNIWRGEYFYKDTGNFEYNLIFPLKELEFEGIRVFVPGMFEKFCQICYDAFPPALPPIEKRFPMEGLIDPFNAHPLVLKKYKDVYTERTNEWFRRTAMLHSKDKPLHHSSGWSYLDQEKWEAFINECVSSIDFNRVCSVFEGGCGVGAVLSTLKTMHPHLELFGSDICSEAIQRCHENVPDCNCTIASVCDLSTYEKNHFDFTISVCVLSYLPSLSEVKRAVDELIRITKPGSHIHLCVFTEDVSSLKSLRILVPKEWWIQFSSSVHLVIRDISLTEFKGRYNVYMEKL